ncbi:MAG: NACHT domain-containing protein, partial [Ardenticatenaceae bacterium]
MAAQTLQLYLERIQLDEPLRDARRTLLPVTLTPAIPDPAGMGFRGQGTPLDIEAFLDHFLPKEEQGPLVRHVAAAVVAPLGAGKSTLLQALVWELAQRALEDESGYAPLPFYLPLERMGEHVAGLLMSALWRVGLPVSRHALGDMLRDVGAGPTGHPGVRPRPLFFFLDPTGSFPTSGAAEALDGIIQELERQWPGCRWLVALRPEAAVALPPSWHDRRFYLLDPLPAESALSHLLRDLDKPLQELLEQLLEEVPALRTLIRRPLIAELLRVVATRFRESDGRRWVTELLLALLAQGAEGRVPKGGPVPTLPRVDALDTLYHLARGGEGGAMDGGSSSKVHESLMPLLAAGMVEQYATEGRTPSFRFTDSALRELARWWAGADGMRNADSRMRNETAENATDAAAVQSALRTRVPARAGDSAIERLPADWDQIIVSQDLARLAQLQQQLDQMRA